MSRPTSQFQGLGLQKLMPKCLCVCVCVCADTYMYVSECWILGHRSIGLSGRIAHGLCFSFAWSADFAELAG